MSDSVCIVSQSVDFIFIQSGSVDGNVGNIILRIKPQLRSHFTSGEEDGAHELIHSIVRTWLFENCELVRNTVGLSEILD